MDALRGRMLTAREVSKAIGISEKEVIEHLPHVEKTVNRSGASASRFLVNPSECLSCGFIFRKRDRLKTPGKCPVCKSEEITETRYGIVEN